MENFTEWGIPKPEPGSTKRPAEENDSAIPSKVMKTNPVGPSFKNIFKQLSRHRTGLLFELDSESPQDQSYTMVVDVDGQRFQGTGHSKRNAKLIAAAKVLDFLQSQEGKTDPGTTCEEVKFDVLESTIKQEQRTEVVVATSQASVNNEAVPVPTPKANQSPYTPLTEEQKRLQMLGKNPVMMLREIRPNFHSEIVSGEQQTGPQRTVEIIFEVDGQKFSGTGRSKKRARARAAQKALETLFHLEFTDFGEDEIPVYLGDDTLWRRFTKKGEKKAAAPPPGKPVKNAMMQLNDMYKGLVFNFSERTGPDHCPFFKVTVEVENQTYEGSGSTKKAAKMDAAEKALEGLELSGVLAQKLTKKKQQKTGMQKPWRPQTQQPREGNSGKSVSYPHLGESFKPAARFANGGKAGNGTNDQWKPQGVGRGADDWNKPAWMGQGEMSDMHGNRGGQNSYVRGRGRGGSTSGPRGRGRGGSGSSSRGGASGGWGNQSGSWDTDTGYGQYTENYDNSNYGSQMSWGAYSGGYSSSYDSGYDTYQGDASQWGQDYYSY